MAVRDTARLEEHMRRTAIDRLRVALSRPTDTLVFVDVDADDATLMFSRNLLGDAARFEPEDLVEHLADAETTVEERVEGWIDEARALVGERPARAWQRADQAVKLLGDPDLPNGVSDNEIRHRARTTLLATAARLLVDGVPEGVMWIEVTEAASLAAADLDSSVEGHQRRVEPNDLRPVRGPSDTSETTTPPFVNQQALRELEVWSESADRGATAPFGLLNATLALGDQGDWLKAGTPTGRANIASRGRGSSFGAR